MISVSVHIRPHTAVSAPGRRSRHGWDGGITISGIYSEPRHVIAYDDGEVRQAFSIVFRGRAVGGATRTSDESTHVAWIDPQDVPSLTIDQSMRLRIHHALANRPEPFLS